MAKFIYSHGASAYVVHVDGASGDITVKDIGGDQFMDGAKQSAVQNPHKPIEGGTVIGNLSALITQ